MPIVKDQNVRSVQPAAQVRDFYSRPAVNRVDRLSQIAEAYRGFSTNLGQYLDRKRKEREDIEIAQGQELYRRRLEYGEEFNAEEMAEKARNGDYEGFKNLTKFQKEGIRRMRHEIFGAKLQEHMLTWAGNATITDRNGNQVPLSMAEDTDAVIRAFYQESARYAQEKTGGQYDPRLAQEHIRTAERNAFNQFINNQAAQRNNQIRLEQQAVLTEVMDELMPKLINSDEFYTNPEMSLQHFNGILSNVALECIRNGFTEQDTKEFLGQYMQYALRNTRDDDAIDILQDLAMQHIIFQDPLVREQIIAAAEQGHQANEYRRRREERQKSEQAERTVFDLLNKRRNGEDVSQELQQLSLSSEEAAKAYLAMSELYAKVFEASRAMSPEEYDKERIAFMRGKKGYSELGAMYERLNDAQRDELWGYVKANEDERRRWQDDMEKRGIAVTPKQYETMRNKEFTALENKLKPFLTPYKDLSVVNVGAFENMKSEILVQAMVDYEAWKAEYSKEAQNPFLADRKRAEIMSDIAPRYLNNYNSYTDNPSLIRENPNEVRYSTAYSNVQNTKNALKTEEQQRQFVDALETENAPVIERLLIKTGTKKSSAATEAAKLIRDYKYVIDTNEKIQAQQEGGGV